MPNWLSSMQQTFEYYIVNPNTWKDEKRIDNVISCTIDNDAEAETLGSASFDIAASLGECYVRTYLITIQNGIREKHPLGTHLIQTPSSNFDGMRQSVTMDAYTPLMELKENKPPIGYYIPKRELITDTAYSLVREKARAPVIKAVCDEKLYSDFVSNTDDTWLTFLTDLLANAKYRFGLDEMGRILFAPNQDATALSPVYTFNDDNSSILYPDITMDHDLYGIPNVVEVIYSDSSSHFYAKVVNDDPNSPISTVRRGREIVYRVDDPSIVGDPTDDQIREYATRLLKELSTIEYRITYSHGYVPVRIGDCVRLNYASAGLVDVRAKVVQQTIQCVPGCPVSETAVFTTKLWG